MADPQPQPQELSPLDASEVPPEVADPDSKYTVDLATETRPRSSIPPPAPPPTVVEPAPKPAAPAPEATVVTRAPAPKPDPQPAPIAPFAGVLPPDPAKPSAAPMATQLPPAEKPAPTAAPTPSNASGPSPGAVVVEKQEAPSKPVTPQKQSTQAAEQNKPKSVLTKDAAVVVVEKESSKPALSKEPAVIVVEKDQAKSTAVKEAPVIVVEKEPAKTPPAGPPRPVEIIQKPGATQPLPTATPANVKVEVADQSKGQVKEHHYHWLNDTKREKFHLFLRKNHLQLIHSHEDPAEVRKRKVEHAQRAHELTHRTRDKLRMLYWGHAARAAVKSKV